MAANGAPRILRKIRFLEGEWEVKMSVRSDPRADWMESTGRSVFRWILDGGVMEQEYAGKMGDRPFLGQGWLAFNRYSGKWQHTWADNIAAILSIYEGDFEERGLVVIGAETTPESAFYVRVTWYNISDESFEWILETSPDRENWTPNMKAVYKRA